MKITELSEGTEVLMTDDKNYTMRARFVQYLPDIQRYKFLIKLGNDEGTTVLFPHNIMEKYNFVENPDFLM